MLENQLWSSAVRGGGEGTSELWWYRSYGSEDIQEIRTGQKEKATGDVIFENSE